MDRLRITIPNLCTAEVQYVMHCVFGMFLDLDYTIDMSKTNDIYTIQFGTQKICIDNHFFVSNDLSELYSINSIPKQGSNANCIIGDVQYPFICMFGSEDVVVTDGTIHFKSDLIASIYFMLTRWEEQVIRDRDMHDRFPGHSSFAFQNNFLDRPIVNEYVELLWQSLLYMGYKGDRKERTYNVVPTHDIDDPLMWMKSREVFRSLMFSTIKSPNFNELKQKLSYWSKGIDPYDTYDMMMDLAEDVGVKSTFYFLTGGNTSFDGSYNITDENIHFIIRRIQERGHVVGLHPSYDTYLDAALLEEEKENFKDIDIEHSRQHYLKVSVPATWTIWQQVGIGTDRTMGYADVAGFRCGVCYPFPLFDFNNRQQLDVIEQPLIAMDVSLQQYEKLSPSQCIQRIESLKLEIKKYKGDFVFLWHNSSFVTATWKKYEDVFYNLYK